VTVVETEWLVLRPWRADDIEELLRLYTDPDVMRHISGGRPLSRERVEGSLERSMLQWRDKGYGPWIALDKASGTWLGEIGLNEIPDWPGEHKVEVGWELHRAWWGRGLAPEGGRAALRFGFQDHRLERIISVTHPENVNSRRVMEKIGLTCQGELPFRTLTAVWYAIDRAEWARTEAD
jgi:RimJ/RimL family protein N-acetyltransferase